MPKPKSDLLQGTPDLLTLKILDLEPMHGWGISQRILQIFRQRTAGESRLALSGASPAGGTRLDYRQMEDLRK
jgi:hypothetical protein